jgi:hypothetical protein
MFRRSLSPMGYLCPFGNMLFLFYEKMEGEFNECIRRKKENKPQKINS